MKIVKIFILILLLIGCIFKKDKTYQKEYCYKKPTEINYALKDFRGHDNQLSINLLKNNYSKISLDDTTAFIYAYKIGNYFQKQQLLDSDEINSQSPRDYLRASPGAT
jgi:hypothetical protein